MSTIVRAGQGTVHEGPTVGGFASQMVGLGREAGLQKLGCTLYTVEPGKTSFPHHWHAANEEAIYILSGRGTLRLGEETHAVGPGDFLGFPTGPAHAHQLIAAGEEPLRYLCLSTKIDTEICGYPDSGKVAALAGSWAAPVFRANFPVEAQVDYFHGEPRAKG